MGSLLQECPGMVSFPTAMSTRGHSQGKVSHPRTHPIYSVAFHTEFAPLSLHTPRLPWAKSLGYYKLPSLGTALRGEERGIRLPDVLVRCAGFQGQVTLET